MSPAPKLYIIVRSDLSAGQQAVQGIHAALAFFVRYPLKSLWWMLRSNTLAFLAVPYEETLGVLLDQALHGAIAAIGFREPDRNNELTAIAIEPRGAGLAHQLPSALKNHGHHDSSKRGKSPGRTA